MANKEINDGNLLRHLMWKYDVTVQELADKAGVSTQTVKNFWRDRVTIATERDLWVAMYCLRGKAIGLANFNSYMEHYYSKKQMQILEAAASQISTKFEVDVWS